MRSIFYFLLFTILATPVMAAAITYQGQLQQQGQPFSGTANLEFRLFDSVDGATQIGPVQTRDEVSVQEGLFQVELEFGANAFDGSARFLEVRVNGAPLTPRQAVRPSPMALFALGGNEGPQGPEGASPFTLSFGTIEYSFNDSTFRFQPYSDSSEGPKITLGHADNRATGVAATVSGGGSPFRPNVADGRYSKIGGGSGNFASGLYSTVAGGRDNTAGGFYSTIAGGLGNCAGGRFSWAGGRDAKVRPGILGGRCAGVSLASGSRGDEATFVWSDAIVPSDPFVSTGSQQFLVRARGGFGINTNAPDRDLHVKQRSTSNGEIGIQIERSGNSNNWAMYIATSDNLGFRYNDNLMSRINSSDGAYVKLSDADAKRSVEPLEGVLDKLLQLRPSSYWMLNDSESESRSTGLIAQQVEALFPDSVSLQDGLYGIKYSEITVLNTAALIELDERYSGRIAALSRQVDRLAREAEQLRGIAARNAELEARMAATRTESADLEKRIGQLEALLVDGPALAGGTP